jgi:hypothetical protein
VMKKTSNPRPSKARTGHPDLRVKLGWPPAKRRHRLVSVLKFQFDESYDKEHRCMVVAGWIAEQNEWRRLETQWSRCINRQNEKHGPEQRITRFHAAPLNGFKGEFEHWSKEMSAEFCGKLVNLIKRRMMGIIAIGVDMDALREIFPDGPEDRRQNAYGLCIQQVMESIGHVMRNYFPEDQVMVVHDHGDWDKHALGAFNTMVDDPRWDSRKYFHSLTSMTSTQSIGLQSADLIAYEAFKLIHKRLVKDVVELRWALQQFAGEVPSEIGLMTHHTVLALREAMAMRPEQPL